MEKKILGLSDKEVLASRELYGSNTLSQKEKEGFGKKLLNAFWGDPINRILGAALLINVVFFFLGKTEWYESLGIAIAVVISTTISAWSEYSNEESFQKLQEDASRIKIKVYRNGQIEEILIDDIVQGDYILLQAGDKIPADGHLVDGQIDVDQSSLNGESKEAEKYVRPDEYMQPEEIDFLNPHELYRGSVVCLGEGVMLVDVVGDNSVFGNIASEMQVEERESPLTVKLGDLGSKISKFGYLGSLAIAFSFLFKKIVLDNGFDINLIMGYFSNWQTPLNDFVTAIILAIIIIVVAVPEGLPMMVAMVLSLNMKKLLKDNILVRKLVGIETAGSLNILFSDKTGTITKGQLEAVTFIDGNLNDYDSVDTLSDNMKDILTTSIKSNTNAVIVENDGKLEPLGGNATERALINFVIDEKVDTGIKTIKTVPFNSENKYSATQIGGLYNLTLVKGASERIVEKCSFFYDSEGNKLKLDDKSQLMNKVSELANRSIRVIALATSEEALLDENDFKDLTLVGLMGIRDDLRIESVEAIKMVKNAGVHVVMITGDNKQTATAIAKEAGIVTSSSDVILTSTELKELTDEKVKEILPNLKVISRALPMDKSRLVRISQELELVVGMTGDGVNDSPALKLADVGFAMGSGTEVAKEAGDIVILDDNFKSITKTILYGRTIFNNIRKFIVYQMAVNVGAIIIGFVGPFIGIEFPLSMTQMLWVNLVMDTLAALAFGGEPALDKYMEEAPKSRSENIVNKDMWSSIIINGVFVAVISAFYLKSSLIQDFFRVGPSNNPDIYYQTGFFTFFMFLNAFNIFNARTSTIHLLENIGQNKGFIKVVAFIFTVQVLMTYLGGNILRTAGLNLREWILIIGMSFLIIPVDMIRKVLRDKFFK